MLLENNQQLYHTFFESYIDQDNILLKKDLQNQLCNSVFKFCIDQELNQIQKSIY